MDGHDLGEVQHDNNGAAVGQPAHQFGGTAGGGRPVDGQQMAPSIGPSLQAENPLCHPKRSGDGQSQWMDRLGVVCRSYLEGEQASPADGS